MSRRYVVRWTVVSFLVAAVALVVGHQGLLAAPKTESEKAAAAEKPASKKSNGEKRTTNKPVATDEQTPHMPAHFGKVVTDEQRPKIVAILQEFAPQIQQKRAELKSLTDNRDKAVFKILSPDQRRQVEELRAEAAAKRAAVAAEQDGAAEKPTTSKPAKSAD